jgi:mevalonate kinase
MNAVRVQAPAKLILSGEHAVLYNCPALAVAIDLQTQVNLQFDEQAPAGLHLNLVDLEYQAWLSWDEVISRGLELQSRYMEFQQGQRPINRVLTRPSDLVVLALTHQPLPNKIRQQACLLTLSSQSWMGRGLGSSAACLLALIAAWDRFIATDAASSIATSTTSNEPLDLNQLIVTAQQLENWQHGRSSGLDPSIIGQGGAVRFEGANGLTPLNAWPLNAWLIDTGAPASSTGDCVIEVARRFDASADIWAEFNQVTEQMQQAWLSHDLAGLQQQLNTNHQLLVRLGVVPSALAKPISELQHHGGVKLCGAGSVSGDAGGVLIYIGDTNPAAICDQQGWRFQTVQLGAPGLVISRASV